MREPDACPLLAAGDLRSGRQARPERYFSGHWLSQERSLLVCNRVLWSRSPCCTVSRYTHTPLHQRRERIGLMCLIYEGRSSTKLRKSKTYQQSDKIFHVKCNITCACVCLIPRLFRAEKRAAGSSSRTSLLTAGGRSAAWPPAAGRRRSCADWALPLRLCGSASSSATPPPTWSARRKGAGLATACLRLSDRSGGRRGQGPAGAFPPRWHHALRRGYGGWGAILVEP